MVWKVPRQLLASNGDLGRLRNIGFSLRPGAPDVHFSRLMTRLWINFRVNQDAAGTVNGVTLFTNTPACTIAQPSPMIVQVSATMDAPSELAWDFGDGSPILSGVPTGTPSRRARADVTLIERTRDGGRKILISGGGRCNVLPAVLDGW